MVLVVKQAVIMRSNSCFCQNRRLKTITELRKIPSQMFGADAMMRATQHGLTIGNQDMHPW